MSVLRLPTSSRRKPAAGTLPPVFPPMLATLAGGLPTGAKGEWAYEYKWDGIRALARWDGRALQLLTRNLNDVTARYPELAPLGNALGRRPVILDGEIIALGPDERPSFAALQRRMLVQDARSIARLVSEVPVSYV